MSDRFLTTVNSWTEEEINDKMNRVSVAKCRLKACSIMINQAVGDAISDMLMVLSTLKV